MFDGMFSIVCDKDGNPLSAEEFAKMDIEGLILLLRAYVKKIDYLNNEDKIALSFFANSLLHRFQYYYGKKEEGKTHEK